MERRIREIEQRMDLYDGRNNSMRTTAEASSMMYITSHDRSNLNDHSQSQMQHFTGPSGALHIGSGALDVEKTVVSPAESGRKVGSFREQLQNHINQKRIDAMQDGDGEEDFDQEPRPLVADANSRNESQTLGMPRHSLPAVSQDLEGSLAVKKKLRQHLIVQGFYNKKADYKALASTLIGKPKKSAVGLLDMKRQIVQKYENDDVCGTSKFSPRIKKAARIAPLDESITNLTIQKIQKIAERSTPRRAELASGILNALRANMTPSSTNKFMLHNSANFYHPHQSPPVIASPFLHQPSGALDGSQMDLLAHTEHPSLLQTAQRGMATSNETFGEVYETTASPFDNQ